MDTYLSNYMFQYLMLCILILQLNVLSQMSFMSFDFEKYY